MFNNILFGNKISFLNEAFSKHNACRILFGSHSNIIFNKSGECLVELLSLPEVIGVNIEHVDGDKICRMSIYRRKGKISAYFYDDVTGEETEGLLNDKMANNLLKIVRDLYDRKINIYAAESDFSNVHPETLVFRFN